MSGTEKQPENKEKPNVSQKGLGDIPTDISLNVGVDDNNDSDSKAGSETLRPDPKLRIPMSDLDQMVADSLKDIDVYDDDGDDDDPDLLNELSEIIEPKKVEQDVATVKSPVDLILPTTNLVPEVLKSRLEMYKIAEENAKAANDSSRARRFERGLKTLETMLKQALAGETVNMESIPPEVVTHEPKSPASPTTEKVQNDNFV